MEYFIYNGASSLEKEGQLIKKITIKTLLFLKEFNSYYLVGENYLIYYNQFLNFEGQA